MEETGTLARIIQGAAIGLPAILGVIVGVLEIPVVIPSHWWWIVAGVAVLGSLLFNVARRAHRLEEERKPRIEVKGPLVYTDPKLSEGLALRTFMVSITNTSSAETIRNCQVKLVSMTNKHGSPSKEVGRQFKLRTDNPPDELNMVHQRTFDILPQDWIEVDIARFDERTTSNYIYMRYALQGPRDMQVNVGCHVDVCPHTLVIRAVAENGGPPVDMALKYWVQDGRFHLVRA